MEKINHRGGKKMGEYKKCPFCRTDYETELTRPKNDRRLIQQIFPDEPLWKREQLISSVCSQECWDRYIGGKIK